MASATWSQELDVLLADKICNDGNLRKRHFRRDGDRLYLESQFFRPDGGEIVNARFSLVGSPDYFGMPLSKFLSMPDVGKLNAGPDRAIVQT